jgi:pimeloyl-ACP methyl ester carboxylesterase
MRENSEPRQRWRGVKALVHDAIDATAHLVGESHDSVARNVQRVANLSPPLGKSLEQVEVVRRAVTAAVLQGIRDANRALARVSDTALDSLLDTAAIETAPLPLRSDLTGTPRWLADAALGSLNGAIGDHLAAQGNPCDMGMQLRAGDAFLPEQGDLAASVPQATGRIAVLIHGLSGTEWAWCIGAREFHGDATAYLGTFLRRDLGYTPVLVRYNSGVGVARNGHKLADLLQGLTERWPVPIEDLVLIGHSMGGLVAQSACDVARRQEQPWLGHVQRLFCLGTPQQGATLEQAVGVATALLRRVDLPWAQISAQVLQKRSEGIRDLRDGQVAELGAQGDRHGTVPDEQRHPIPLQPGIAYYFVAATVAADPHKPLAALGDLMVRVASASGPAAPPVHVRIETHTVSGAIHQKLQNHPEVCRVVLEALARPKVI